MNAIKFFQLQVGVLYKVCRIQTTDVDDTTCIQKIGIETNFKSTIMYHLCQLLLPLVLSTMYHVADEKRHVEVGTEDVACSPSEAYKQNV